VHLHGGALIVGRVTREAPVVLWFRRDLRLGDHAALLEASRHSKHVLALFVLDEALLKPSGDARTAFLHGCLAKLDEQLGGRLMLVRGTPAAEVVRAARKIGASAVHVSADAGPYGRRRDAEVAKALADNDIAWVETGSPYAVTPGRVTKPDGRPYRVFTPFHRAWRAHGWPGPADTGPSLVDWVAPPKSLGVPRPPKVSAELPEPGEQAALTAWHDFLDGPVETYDTDRNRPDRDGTTRLSPYLHWGCVHPRTLLADLAGDDRPGANTLRGEFCWREFHADVLWHRPETARRNYDKRFDAMEHDDDREAFARWCAGRTGFPIVDAGMRQLLAEGWMHNRIRMVVASFLVKDLHLPWWLGARYFMNHLVDGDLASNQLNWQWVAGSGTDAAPYFRVFNPTTQGLKFDPDGDYVRKYVPELRSIPGKAVHQPKDRPADYPEPMVDHAHERQVSLERYNRITSVNRAGPPTA
jgi:deoxyribodipyrimidine photo-lyase